jgi:hypothetical protein
MKGASFYVIRRIDPSGLTSDEATYILNFRDADTLRARAAKAALGSGRGSGPQSLRASASEDSRVTPSSEITPERIAALEPVLRKRLAAVGLDGKVALQVVAAVRSIVTGKAHAGAAGSYHERVIQVAAGGSNPMLSLNHEIIHALRDMNILRGLDWKALEKHAAGDKAIMAYVERSYPNLTRSEQLEEAVAEMFGKWADGRAPKGFVGRAWERVAAFFKALASGLRQGGFADAIRAARAVGVMQDIDSGRLRDSETGQFVAQEKFHADEEVVRRGEAAMEKLRTEPATTAAFPFTDLAHEPNRSVVEALKYSDGKLIERIKAATTRKAIGESVDRWRSGQLGMPSSLATSSRTERTPRPDRVSLSSSSTRMAAIVLSLVSTSLKLVAGASCSRASRASCWSSRLSRSSTASCRRDFIWQQSA